MLVERVPSMTDIPDEEQHTQRTSKSHLVIFTFAWGGTLLTHRTVEQTGPDNTLDKHQELPLPPLLNSPPPPPPPSPSPSPPPLSLPTLHPSLTSPVDQQASVSPNLDDIKLEYHPATRRETVVYPFEHFRQVRPSSNFAATAEEPWLPFETRGDFELAEIVHKARMSHELTDRLLKLIRDVRIGEAELSFNSSGDIRQAWEHASQFYPTVCSDKM